MSENQNELSETQRRADRINAIKKSIHTSAPEEQAETAVSPAPQQPSGTGEWESELSDRIAQRIRKVKENKHSAAAEIISELDAAMEAEDQLSAKADDAAGALSEAQDADPAEDIINEEADETAVQEPETESVESQIDRAVAALAAAAEEAAPTEEEVPAQEEAPTEEAAPAEEEIPAPKKTHPTIQVTTRTAPDGTIRRTARVLPANSSAQEQPHEEPSSAQQDQTADGAGCQGCADRSWKRPSSHRSCPRRPGRRRMYGAASGGTAAGR